MLKRTHDTAFIAGAIYFTQGFLGIASIALPLYMRSLKWSIPEITVVTSIAALPWLFKIVYGFISDAFPLAGFRRKSYLILFSLLSASGWLWLSLLPKHTSQILMAMMLTNLGFAATDVITDGVIVEHSVGSVSSVYQSIAWGSRSAGSVLSGLFSGWLAIHWTPQYVFLATMMLPLVVCVCSSLIHERKNPEMIKEYSFSFLLKHCWELLASPNLKYFAFILFAVSLSASFAVPLFFHMKETLLFHETYLGFLSSVGWGGAGLGSIIYMRWLRAYPSKQVLRWAILLNSINILSTLLITDQRSAFAIVFLGGTLGCLVMLPIASSAAALTHQSGVESTLFAILMSIFNFGQICFGYLGGKLFNVVGLAPLITLSGLMALTGLLFIRKLELVPSKPYGT